MSKIEGVEDSSAGEIKIKVGWRVQRRGRKKFLILFPRLLEFQKS